MKTNLKNELWKSNPHDAKIAFEKELREMICQQDCMLKKVPKKLRLNYHSVRVEEILGEV